MSTPEKPNVELEAPENRPTAEELYSDPAERVVFSHHEGMAGFWRLIVPVGLFLVAAGAVFATLI